MSEPLTDAEIDSIAANIAAAIAHAFIALAECQSREQEMEG